MFCFFKPFGIGTNGVTNKTCTGPTRLINTTEIPSVVFFIASAHVFYYKKLVKKPSRKKPRKNPGQKKAGPEAPENSFKKPIQNS